MELAANMVGGHDDWNIDLTVNAKPIVIETTKILDLPPICVCCGKKTKCTIVVKPIDPSSSKQEFALNALALAIPLFHFVLAAKMFSTPNAKIPLCRKCRFNHFFPDKKLFVALTLLVLFFIDAFYWGFRAQYGGMLLNLLLAIACLLFVAKKNIIHDRKTLPVQVYQSNGKYRYAIFGGPLYDQYNNQLKTAI